MNAARHSLVRKRQITGAVRLALILLLAGFVPATGGPIPVILDTDIGDDIDDALALAFALRSPELDVRAVITVFQNREGRADLAWRILKRYGRTGILIGMGAEKPLLAPPRTGPVLQTQFPTPDERMPDSQRRNGIQLLIDTCLKSPGKVTVVAYGPLTNIALALRAEPRIKDKIEHLVVMNGRFFSPGTEYNTTCDPEAAAIVFDSGIPITAVGLDVTMQCELEPADMARMERAEGPAKFIRDLVDFWYRGHPEPKHRPILHDPLAVAVVFQPGLIRTETGRVVVETRGQPGRTYGMTLFRPDPKGTTRVAAAVEARRFMDLFMDRVF
ncbi:MAG TPA: nucleoside hydrolase [Bryobacteraceae bacterium]|nr:nucleoside hydrolase [Bryobacteraceae bacterium]HOQ44148.1 nucleoside hydrolase [Bryobacteraceae bacterium]HPQ14192.1 nucleoside hydrolase [Bryobacteraceae bacterium]HPU70466.1 nucleoside hydrolase [Bryobacteraceae bacterium]